MLSTDLAHMDYNWSMCNIIKKIPILKTAKKYL